MRRRDLILLGVVALPVLTGCQSSGIDLTLRPPEVQAASDSAPTTKPPPLGRLAFVRDGDVWVKDLPDGAEQPITAADHADTPLWSASGEWLGYRVNQRTFWVARRDGSRARHVVDIDLGPWPTVAWAPRGQPDRLAFIDRGGLVVEEASGANQRQVVAGTPDQPFNGVLSFSWSADGEWLAYGKTELRQSGAPGQRGIPVGSLARIRDDGTGLQQLWRRDVFPNGVQSMQMVQNGGAPILAAWADSDRTILYWVFPFSMSLLADGTALVGIAANGGQAQPIVPFTLVDGDFLAVAPNGRSLAVTTGGGRETWTNKQIAIVDLPNGQPRRVTGPGVAAYSPSWPPDSQSIAYVAQPDVGHVGGGPSAEAAVMRRHIWVVHPSGGVPRQLTADPAYRDEYPQWSADGRWIMFARVHNAQRQVWLMRADGSEPRPVVDQLASGPGPWDYYGYVGWNRLYAWWRP